MTPELEALREIALRFKIDPVQTVGHAARVDSVLHALGGINNSFRAFIRAEFLKNPDFLREYQKSTKVLDAVLDKLQLLIVDVQFSSFAPAVVPDLSQASPGLFTQEVVAWETERFKEFRDDVVAADFENPDYFTYVARRYTEAERSAIFQPLFGAAGNGQHYTLKLLNSRYEEVRTVRPPAKEIQPFYQAPKAAFVAPVDAYKTVQVFAKVRADESLETLKKKDIQGFYYWEPMEHQTYPFKPDFLRFGGRSYVLKEKLDGQVSYEEGQYFITNDLLDITVWGDTRDAAEEAFAFSFHSLYKNYAEEVDDALTESACRLKATLQGLVVNIIERT